MAKVREWVVHGFASAAALSHVYGRLHCILTYHFSPRQIPQNHTVLRTSHHLVLAQRGGDLRRWLHGWLVVNQVRAGSSSAHLDGLEDLRWQQTG